MDKSFQDYTVALVSELKAISPPSYVPPNDGAKPKTEMVLARSLVSNTRGYIERVVAQINGTYENGWYDGCAVMIRRLLETLIATVYKGNIIKNLIMDCQSYTKYRPNETTGGIFVSWRRKEELPTGA